ncbi:hypothetical protein WJ87_08665 [Burkholderia ubonensis]|nr:hypothetical protein WJ87_08665 [Burkholderia ubonensis]
MRSANRIHASGCIGMMRQATEPRRPFMLPFHHPAELAHRICMPDHISQRRLMVGIGASGANLELEMLDR